MLDLVPILRDLREEFAASVPRQPAVPPNPLNISPWLAKALLQKACRRGETEWALRAAATLFLVAPDALWKRITCIAFEDVGLANLDAVISVATALAGKRYRATLGGEWQVASHLVRLLTTSAKCRATDDLLLAAEHHPALSQARHHLPGLTVPELMKRAVVSSHPLPERALALWFGTGTDLRPSPRLSFYRGDPELVFSALLDAGVPGTLAITAREGFRSIREVLCPFICLLSLEGGWKEAATADDDIPAVRLVHGLPGWAVDLYSREGRRALHAFLDTKTETAQWIASAVPSSERVEFLGTLVFRVEGGLMRARLQWPHGEQLRRQVDRECFAMVADAGSLLETMRLDLPVLDEVRAHVLQ